MAHRPHNRLVRLRREDARMGRSRFYGLGAFPFGSRDGFAGTLAAGGGWTTPHPGWGFGCEPPEAS